MTPQAEHTLVSVLPWYFLHYPTIAFNDVYLGYLFTFKRCFSLIESKLLKGRTLSYI